MVGEEDVPQLRFIVIPSSLASDFPCRGIFLIDTGVVAPFLVDEWM